MFNFLKRRRMLPDYYKCKIAKRFDGPFYLYMDSIKSFLRDKLRWENYLENPLHVSLDIIDGDIWIPISSRRDGEIYIPLPTDLLKFNVKIISEEKNTFALQEIVPLAGQIIKPVKASSYRVHWLRVISIFSLPGEIQLSVEVLKAYS